VTTASRPPCSIRWPRHPRPGMPAAGKPAPAPDGGNSGGQVRAAARPQPTAGTDDPIAIPFGLQTGSRIPVGVTVSTSRARATGATAARRASAQPVAWPSRVPLLWQTWPQAVIGAALHSAGSTSIGTTATTRFLWSPHRCAERLITQSRTRPRSRRGDLAARPGSRRLLQTLRTAGSHLRSSATSRSRSSSTVPVFGRLRALSSPCSSVLFMSSYLATTLCRSARFAA
jgi:hypothetical protein